MNKRSSSTKTIIDGNRIFHGFFTGARRQFALYRHVWAAGIGFAGPGRRKWLTTIFDATLSCRQDRDLFAGGGRFRLFGTPDLAGRLAAGVVHRPWHLSVTSPGV